MKVLCTLGYTPSVVTEFIDWLNRKNIRVKEVYILGTSDEKVKKYYNVVKFALKKELKINAEYIELPFEEPIKDEDFIITVKEILSRIKSNGIFNIAGGRKNTILASYFAAMLTGSKVYHIINTDTKSFNIEVEQHRDDLEKAGESEEAFNLYYDKIKKVLFPDPKEYYVIEIPTIPITKPLIDIIKGAMNGKKVEEINTESIIDSLKYLEYIQVTSSGKVIVTDKGEKILNLLELL